MKRIAALAAALVVATAPRALAGPGGGRDGEVRAVSVLPAAGKVEVVIDLQGAVDVRDFTLNGPDRLVIDLLGARLVAPATLYDGQNRGGIKNIRYAQFRPDVVRIVIDLDALKDYQVERRDGQVRVAIGTDSLASVEDLNLFAEMAEVRRLAPEVPAARILESATLAGAEALGFASELGSLEPGKRAQLLAVRLPADVTDVEQYLVSGIDPGDIRWLDT